MDGAGAVEAADARRTVERAQHDRDAAVLADVGDGLDAAAGEIEVRDPVRPEDRERAASPLGDRFT